MRGGGGGVSHSLKYRKLASKFIPEDCFYNFPDPGNLFASFSDSERLYSIPGNPEILYKMYTGIA